jgi:hypothetical protein
MYSKDKIDISQFIDKLSGLNCSDMYLNDFFLTWEKTDYVYLPCGRHLKGHEREKYLQPNI